MKCRGSGYCDHIIDCIFCHNIVMVTSHSTVIDALVLTMHLYRELLGSVDTIICGVDFHWKSCIHVLTLKLQLGYDGLLNCEGDLMTHTDIDGG